MMIRLTYRLLDGDVYVNPLHIVTIRSCSWAGALVQMGYRDAPLQVRETPEEILKLIAESPPQ